MLTKHNFLKILIFHHVLKINLAQKMNIGKAPFKNVFCFNNSFKWLLKNSLFNPERNYLLLSAHTYQCSGFFFNLSKEKS